MRSRHLVAAAFASMVGLAGAGMSACVGDEPAPPVSVPDASEASTIPATKLANGQACAAGAECQTGQCADGVCCESACSGTCERCNLPGTAGRCEPIPDGTDPDKECPTVPLPEPDAGAPLDAGDEAGDGGGGPADGGLVFSPPDGGLPPANDNMCAGHCNGKRACSFKGKETTCGASFCGNGQQEGRATCDGAGHCIYGIQECSAYACADGSPGCKAACVSHSDCLATHYCDGTTCKPRVANGVSCTAPDACASGICDTYGGAAGLCCNVDCDPAKVPGGTCRAAGAGGTCKCNACATGGACALYYQDLDGDGYGDMTGTTGNGRAKYDCEAGPAPAGFVKDNTDCFDSAAAAAKDVHPNQTAYFQTPFNGPTGTSFDYNCSGTPEKETVEGVACGFCSRSGGGVSPGPEPEPITEPQAGGIIIVPICGYDKVATCSSTSQAAARTCSFCGGANNAPAFNFPVACGNQGSSYTCEKCTGAGGAGASTFYATRFQRCH